MQQFLLNMLNRGGTKTQMVLLQQDGKVVSQGLLEQGSNQWVSIKYMCELKIKTGQK